MSRTNHVGDAHITQLCSPLKHMPSFDPKGETYDMHGAIAIYTAIVGAKLSRYYCYDPLINTFN